MGIIGCGCRRDRWVNRYGDGACFLEPVPLAMHHRERAERVLARYADLL